MSVFKWLGGGLFLASLAVAAHAYAVTWSLSGPLSPAWKKALLIDALWLTGFALHHSLFARDAVKGAVARLVPTELVRSLYVWVASVLLMVVVWQWQPLGGTLYRLEGPGAWLLRAAQLGGVFLIASAVRAIDGLELAGIRPPGSDAALYVNGPYRLVRHPLYLGWMLLVFGTSHMTYDRLAFASLTTLYLVLAIPWEERSLRRAYGDSYTRYALTVKWRVVPLLY